LGIAGQHAGVEALQVGECSVRWKLEGFRDQDDFDLY
jgi:hypothetical protein